MSMIAIRFENVEYMNIIIDKIEGRNFMYSALVVARYIIDRCNEKEYAISNLKLQKILYFVQAEFLVTLNTPCFFEEIEAWDYGPVVPKVYQKYKMYGGGNIPSIKSIQLSRITRDDQRLINGIIDVCGKYSASKLVEITHHQSPWKSAYQKRDNTIANTVIKEYFME